PSKFRTPFQERAPTTAVMIPAPARAGGRRHGRRKCSRHEAAHVVAPSATLALPIHVVIEISCRWSPEHTPPPCLPGFGKNYSNAHGCLYRRLWAKPDPRGQNSTIL